jgi:hypothetical protein
MAMPKMSAQEEQRLKRLKQLENQITNKTMANRVVSDEELEEYTRLKNEFEKKAKREDGKENL